MEELQKKWNSTDGKDEKLNEALRKARQADDTALGDEDRARDAWISASIAFYTAMQEFLTAVALLTSR
jgi:hypothetical protein